MARGGGAAARASGRAGEDRTPRRRPAGDRRRMNVLGFDTSTAATSACVLRSDGRAFELIPGEAALSAPPAHASELMPALVRVLDDAGLTWNQLDAIAVG